MTGPINMDSQGNRGLILTLDIVLALVSPATTPFWMTNWLLQSLEMGFDKIPSSTQVGAYPGSNHTSIVALLNAFVLLCFTRSVAARCIIRGAADLTSHTQFP